MHWVRASPVLEPSDIVRRNIVGFEARDPFARLTLNVMSGGDSVDVSHAQNLPLFVALGKVPMRLAQGARDVILDGLGRDPQTSCNLLVRA